MQPKEPMESGDQLRLALEAAGVGTWSWDIDTGEVTWSRQHELLFGLTPGSFPGTFEAFVERVYPDDRAEVTGTIRRALEARIDYEAEFRVVWPNGRVRWIGSKGRFLLNAKGKARRMTGVAIDITDRMELEEDRARLLAREQKARKEAELANRLKDEFLATVSHELRTPLTAILGWSRILQMRRHDPATVDRSIETIERNAKALAQIIEDVLDVSRIITGKLRLEFGPVDLLAVLREAVDVTRPTAEAKGVTLAPLEPCSACIVSGDPDRLQQVIWNLLSNAVKFTPQGGRIEVRLSQSEAGVRIRVSDTGQGIRADFLPHMFERFRQADSTTTRSHGGLGLGLAIVRHLVELHGGTVHAESGGEGQGATFVVTLPAQSSHFTEGAVPGRPPSDRPQVSTEAMPLDGIRIVAVDDEADARELLAMVLEKEGAVVTMTASATEALARVTELRPDVLVSDISMPGMDGYMLVRKLRTLSPELGGQTPAIALTAYAREEDRRKALGAGFNVHVPKPIEPSKLVDLVAKLGRRAGAG